MKDSTEISIQEFSQGDDDRIGQVCATVMERAIESVLQEYGVPSNLSPEETVERMVEHGLVIVEIETPNGDERAGIYIFHSRQKEYGNPVMVAYISYPWLNGEQKVICRIERHDTFKEVTPEGIFLPGNTQT